MVAAVVGEVGLLTGAVLALVDLSAEGGRAAREDAPDGPVVGSVELAAMSKGVGWPVLSQEVCEGDAHLAVWGERALLDCAEGA